ncbi:MAG TPA: energy transducer TonB [Polyangia bacterium]
MVTLVLEPRPRLEATSRSRPIGAPRPAELVEMAMIAPTAASTPRPMIGPMVAPAIASTAATRDATRASLAEVASRPGGRAAGPSHRQALPETSPPVTIADEVPGFPADVNESDGETSTPPASSDPVSAAPSGAPLRETSVPTATTAPSLAEGGPGEPGRDGDGGEGTGAGAGRGRGAGEVAADAWGKELRARILGDVRVDLSPRGARPVIGHEEATALRVRDVFPRMPEALWPGWRPYLVALEVCVDEEGGVGEVNLLSSAAPRLDRMVAEAARTWRYRPLVRDGVATAFCHAVVIKYEPW